MYEVFRRHSGDNGPLGVVTANDAFVATYELGMMPKGAWQRDAGLEKGLEGVGLC